MSTLEQAAGRRRSARILALEEKAQALSIQKETTTANAGSSTRAPKAAAQRRGRKRRTLTNMVVNAVNQGEGKCGKLSLSEDKPGTSSPLHQMPSKGALEFLIDILQRRDRAELFAQPIDPEKVVGYYDTVLEPMDFGTMRAKLQEGMYTSLEQFEHDVFLISSNAMTFHASDSVHYAEALAIKELAERLFHSLRSEPENFELVHSRTRRRTAGRKSLVEAGSGSRTKLRTSHKKTTQPLLTSSSWDPYPYQIVSEVSYGSRNFTSERRATYVPRTKFLTMDELTASVVYNAPKQLDLVTDLIEDINYVESLERYVEDLGPTAQRIARRNLAALKSPINSLTTNTSSRSAFIARTTTGSAVRPADPSRGVNDGQISQVAYLNSYNSDKGKTVMGNEGTISVHNPFGERSFFTQKRQNEYQEGSTCTSRNMDVNESGVHGFGSGSYESLKGGKRVIGEGINIHYPLQGQLVLSQSYSGYEGGSTQASRNINVCGSGHSFISAAGSYKLSKGKMAIGGGLVHTHDPIEWQMGLTRSQNSISCPSKNINLYGREFINSRGCYARFDNLRHAASAQSPDQFSMETQTSWLRMSQQVATTSLPGFGYQNAQGGVLMGCNAAAAAAAGPHDHEYTYLQQVISPPDHHQAEFQPLNWSQSAAFGPQCDLAIMQPLQVIERIYPGGTNNNDAFTDEGLPLQVALTHQEMQLSDDPNINMSLSGAASSFQAGYHQAAAAAAAGGGYNNADGGQCLWDYNNSEQQHQSSWLKNEQNQLPDLALSLGFNIVQL